MEIFTSLLTGFLVFIILLGPLMLIHELGHFAVAKKAGIRVEEFGLGLPPRAARLFKLGETEYTLNWLPIGAFVRMTGEENPEDPRSFAAQPKRWRLATLAAGPLMNFLGGFVILTLAYLFFATQPTEFRYRINQVMAGSPAEQIGLQPGDAILAVNGVDMIQKLEPASGVQPDVGALRRQVRQFIGQPIEIVVLRVGEPEQIVRLSGRLPPDANAEAPLGVSLLIEVTKSERVAYTLPEALLAAGLEVGAAIAALVQLPVRLVNQTLALEQLRPISVVGITNIGVELIDSSVTESQGLMPFLRFAAVVSIAIALTNLLPLPALDGGRILFILIEALRGRRVDPRREQWVHAVGFAFLLALSVVVIIMDIVNPVSIR
ncbi:MAG: site-2 protease family protein [Chloroflexi bacterium]|jgi:regulator of sigma E protease|nr:site-2 protease family protein [Chloroflexota bacterium]